MVTRRVSEDSHGFLANASGYQYTQLQKLIYSGPEQRWWGERYFIGIRFL